MNSQSHLHTWCARLTHFRFRENYYQQSAVLRSCKLHSCSFIDNICLMTKKGFDCRRNVTLIVQFSFFASFFCFSSAYLLKNTSTRVSYFPLYRFLSNYYDLINNSDMRTLKWKLARTNWNWHVNSSNILLILCIVSASIFIWRYKMRQYAWNIFPFLFHSLLANQLIEDCTLITLLDCIRISCKNCPT